MMDEIGTYKKTQKAFQDATKALTEAVVPKLKQLVSERDVGGLFELIQTLPEESHIRDRCFQAILEIKQTSEEDS